MNKLREIKTVSGGIEDACISVAVCTVEQNFFYWIVWVAWSNNCDMKITEAGTAISISCSLPLCAHVSRSQMNETPSTQSAISRKQSK